MCRMQEDKRNVYAIMIYAQYMQFLVHWYQQCVAVHPYIFLYNLTKSTWVVTKPLRWKPGGRILFPWLHIYIYIPKWLRSICTTKKYVFNNFWKRIVHYYYYNNGFEEDIYIYEINLRIAAVSLFRSWRARVLKLLLE